MGGHGSGDMAVPDRPAPIPEHEPELADALSPRNGEMPHLEPDLDPPSATSWVRIRLDEHQRDAPELIAPDREGRDAMPPVGRQHEAEPEPGQRRGEVEGAEASDPHQSDGIPTAAMASMSALWLIHTRPRQPGRGRERAKDRRSAGLPPRRP